MRGCEVHVWGMTELEEGGGELMMHDSAVKAIDGVEMIG